MDLIIVAESIKSARPLLQVAGAAGHRLLKLIEAADDVKRYVDALCPDALIFISSQVDRRMLEDMRVVSERRPTMMMVFTADKRAASIAAAVNTGASAYVVDCRSPARLNALLDVACIRFNQQQILLQELSQARNALHERKNIEKAKGIVMSTKQLSEDQAYKAIRKLAMNHNKRIAEVAEQIISASEILV